MLRLVLPILLLALQAPPAVVGRWDLTVVGPGGSRFPSWLEITASGRSALVGRFVGQFGSARPIGRVEHDDGAIRFAIPAQWEEGAGDLHVEGRIEGDTLAGTLITPDGVRHRWMGRRAPHLRRARVPRWGAPVRLFDGRTLAGWKTQGDGESRWRARGGVLVNEGSGANLMTTRTFADFKLRLEFRYPPGGNSGVYLRGRHEVQIEDPGSRTELGPLDIGGVYGFLTPNRNAATRPGAWQRYEITLVGRRVTVILNGRTIIADQIIPGITGGALDSDEGAPGPLLLQGDHTGIEFRNIVITPAR